MIGRILIATTGALIVTAGLLLAMDSLTSLFEDESRERYFRITDVLPKPDPGRPDRPRAGVRAPDSVEIESGELAITVPIEAPAELDTEVRGLVGPEVETPAEPQ